jgi:hypothetical protein
LFVISINNSNQHHLFITTNHQQPSTTLPNMSDPKAAAKKLKDKEEFKRRKSTVGKATLPRAKPTGPPPTEFIQKLSKEGLDKFIMQALESKQIEDVKVLDLSRHKISELSPRVKFYMRMLRQLEKLNLYANKLRKLPGEVGMYSSRFSLSLVSLSLSRLSLSLSVSPRTHACACVLSTRTHQTLNTTLDCR